MDPNGPLEGGAWKDPHPLDPFRSKSLLEKAVEEEIRYKEDQDKCKDNVIKEVDHSIL
jgi:hypothetical protein